MRKIAATASVFAALLAGAYLIIEASPAARLPWDDVSKARWPEAIRAVEIPARDGGIQKAYFRRAEGPAPLIVSLHTWSGDWTQRDALAQKALDRGWNYLHPDIRGPNTRPEACLSDLVLDDIDRAIAYGRAAAEVTHIYVVGASGGGYAALGAWLRSTQPIDKVFAWVPITDLEAWYYQSRARNNQYAANILACTGSGQTLDAEAARARSPLYMTARPPEGRALALYAGVRDGYDGAVPISHSLDFFNMIAEEQGGEPISPRVTGSLLSLAHQPLDAKLGDREVLFQAKAPNVALTIFGGTHEMLVNAQVSEIEAIVSK